MNKNNRSIIMICLLLTIIFYIIKLSPQVIETITFSISIWKDSLFPTLFPFFIISYLLMEYGFVEIIGELLKNFMNKYFNLPGNCGFVLAASLISGFPSGAKYTKDLVAKKYITKEEAEKLLIFSHYSNPLFVLGMIGDIILNNKNIAIIILISHVFSGLLTGFLLTKNNMNYKKEKINIKIKIPDKNFGELLNESIFASLKTLFLLLGTVTIFLVITTIIKNIFNFSEPINILISSILEMTQGISVIANSSYSLLIKTILITATISFGGLSVHTQVISIISEEKIKYKQFLLARIIHSILASLFVFVLYILII